MRVSSDEVVHRKALGDLVASRPGDGPTICSHVRERTTSSSLPSRCIEPRRVAWTGRIQFAAQRPASIPGRSSRRRRLEVTALRRSEDLFVDELAFGAVGARAPLMRAHFPRAYLDVNREPYELDPRMFDGPPAVLRQYPLDAGRGRARHDRAGRRRRAGDLRPAHPGRRAIRAHRGARTSPTTAPCAVYSRACTAISAPRC